MVLLHPLIAICAQSRASNRYVQIKVKPTLSGLHFNTNFLDFLFRLKAGFDCMEFPTAG